MPQRRVGTMIHPGTADLIDKPRGGIVIMIQAVRVIRIGTVVRIRLEKSLLFGSDSGAHRTVA